MSLAKRSRHLESDETLLSGDDGALPEAEVQSWRDEVRRLASTNAQWVDPDFPASQISIKGKEEAPAPSAPPPPPVAPGVRPKCRCGTDATSATVTKDTPNKGRAYYHCPSRACGFFAWADGGEVAFQRGGTAAALQWARDHGCPWSEQTTAAAAGGGHLEILRWCRARRCPWDASTCAAAAAAVARCISI